MMWLGVQAPEGSVGIRELPLTSTSSTQSSLTACPYLGLASDPDSHCAFPQPAQRCYAPAARAALPRGRPIHLEQQAVYCLASEYRACARYTAPPNGDAAPPAALAVHPSALRVHLGHGGIPLVPPIPVCGIGTGPPNGGRDAEPKPGVRGMPSQQAISPWRAMVWTFASLVLIAGLVYYALGNLFSAKATAPDTLIAPGNRVDLIATSTPTPTLTPTPAAAATLDPKLRTAILWPAADQVGWVASDESSGVHWGESFLNAGILEDKIYYSLLRFDLGTVPPGALLRAARVQLVGLRDGQLGSSGTWKLRWLAPQLAERWTSQTYRSVAEAPYLETLAPVLESADLAADRQNDFSFSPAQLQKLAAAISDRRALVLRLEGPLGGPDSFFTWDSGYGPASDGALPSLVLDFSLSQPQVTAAPEEYVVVTSTPTPQDVLAAATHSLQMTADAARYGTATRVPWYWVTATPMPESLISTATATPANEATAVYQAAAATAQALTTGTPTPTPLNMITATPTRTPASTPTFVLITSTPTPLNLLTAQAISLQATEQARIYGTATPLPANWVTPVIISSTPTPENAATLAYWQALATAQALTTGTPTPLPGNAVTATPTAVYVLLNGQLPTPPATYTPTPTPAAMPKELVGKIAFLSDRATLASDPDAEPLSNPLVYVVNPDGTGLALLSERWPYDQAVKRDRLSSDQRFRAFIKDAHRWEGERIIYFPALFFYDYFYLTEEQVSQFGSGIAYDPVWSPTAEQIAFVSNDSGNDEIWVIERDGSDARQLTRDNFSWWDKHPSWSPDGKEIVFWSNRTGVRQIWIMDADGGNLRSLSQTGFNDWDPVWIKYTDPPLREFDE